MLDIVGKGYNDKPIKQYQLRNDSENSPYGSELPVKNQPEVNLIEILRFGFIGV